MRQDLSLLLQDFQQFRQESGGELGAINSLAQDNEAQWNDFIIARGGRMTQLLIKTSLGEDPHHQVSFLEPDQFLFSLLSAIFNFTT